MKINIPALSERQRQIGTFLLIFAFVFVRYCYYGFEYFYQLDDYIQYHNYMAGDSGIWETLLAYGLLAARPLAGFLDLALWSKLYPIMIVGVLLVSAMFAASACLFQRVWSRYFRLGWIFLVVYTLLPMGFEGTYWMSASTRVVGGIFLAALSLYGFQRWCETGKKRYLPLYAIVQLLAYGCYEQVAVLSVASVVLVAILNFKTQRKRALWGLFTFVNAVLYFAFTALFANGLMYGERTGIILPVTAYYWKTFFPSVLKQVYSAFIEGGFFTLAKGFKRGLLFILSDGNILYVLVIAVLCVLLFWAARREKRLDEKYGSAFVIGVLLALAPISIFFILESAWFSMRAVVASFCGIAIVADTLIALLLRRLKCRQTVTAVLAVLFAAVCCVSSVSELHDYKQTTEKDQEILVTLKEVLAEDGILNQDLKVGLLNVEPSYLGNQNYYYHEHIHGVTESWWALTGALTSILDDPTVRPEVTPLSQNPMYYPYDYQTKRLENFDVLYLYLDGQFVPVTAELKGEQLYNLYDENGNYLGYTWEEDHYGYLELEMK